MAVTCIHRFAMEMRLIYGLYTEVISATPSQQRMQCCSGRGRGRGRGRRGGGTRWRKRERSSESSSESSAESSADSEVEEGLDLLNNEPPPAAAAGKRRSVGTPGGSKRPRRLSEKGLSKEPWTEDALRKVLEGDGERVGLLDQLQQTAGSDVRFRQLIGGLFGHAAVQQEIKALGLPTRAEQVVAWGVRDA